MKGTLRLYAKTYGATTLGVDGLVITVEVDSANGLPGFDIVGLPDTAVRESKERVRTAIKNAGIRLRQEKVTINLAPADIRKDSSGLDLPIAIGLLTAYGVLSPECTEGCLFAAELSLEGKLRGICGILPMAVKARDSGFTKMFVSADNANEALLVDGIEIYAAEDLSQLTGYFMGSREMAPATKLPLQQGDVRDFVDDFSDVQGQFMAKRALEVAAAGGHNVLLVGVPGSGKTMLARRMSSILPELTREEALEVTKIYSIAGMLPRNGGLITQRPFRSPHHTASMTSMIGGGSVPRPGEVTLAHNGVLFLDELPEFGKSTLEVLREPIEDRKITISRVHATLTFPSSIILVCAMNPCLCGWNGDPEHECDCSPNEIKRYTKKISGPLLDRIDIHIRVPRVEYKDLSATQKAEPSSEIRKRVEAAREIQLSRFRKNRIFCNAQMTHALIRKLCPLTERAQSMLEQVFKKMHMSARSYDRIIKVSRTIADLDHSEVIAEQHIGEAIQFRNDVGLDLN